MKHASALLLALLMSVTTFAETPQTGNKKCEVNVIALVKVKPGYENEFAKNVLTILKPTRKEKGNISYKFHQSLDDKTIFDTYETWKDVSDLAAHLETPHMKAFFDKVGPMFAEGYPVIHTLKDLECKTHLDEEESSADDLY